MLIRQELSTDIAAIDKLNYLAFKDHSHHAPGAEPTEHLIVDKLRTTEALTLSLVVEDKSEKDEIVGHIAFSPITVDGKKTQWFGLSPVAVLPEKRGQGIGSVLIREGISLMKES